MHVQRVLGGPRRVVAPQCLDQAVVLDPLASPDCEHGEQGPRVVPASRWTRVPSSTSTGPSNLTSTSRWEPATVAA